ncbi:MAG TPA: 23S rRNA (adenine(2503)-C(2))-methyltransferase RlmN [Clostridiaceae bacterium]|nr:23S rRNA (adenine(2503)-C(2))-methyltransferase RlmN [Clostridiaceae bacterium]
MKQNLLDCTIEELEALLNESGVEKFRAKQIFQWVNKGIASVDEMTNISKLLRQLLDERFHTGILHILRKLESKKDETKKYLFRLHDNNVVESVLMKYTYGYSACISSQVGCRMGCRFCASTGIGFARNLTCGEMLGQLITIQKDAGIRISNIVIMGIGEPLDNYDNVVRFLRLVNHKGGLNIGYRHITLSTCGLVPRILDLAKENIPITLSISLHAPNDELRNKLMPVNLKYSIDKLIEACKIYTEETGRRITFEYALIKGLNDSKENAHELAFLIKGMLSHVNLIPVNEVEGTEFEKTSKERTGIFKDILEKNGIEVTLRRELGSDINAACGQLRRGLVKE